MFLAEVLEYNSLSFLAKKAMEGFISGLHNSPLKGFSVEFAEHRAYNEGESIRNLDWKLLAKTDKKFIKEFIEETNLRCHIWIDVSESMSFPKNKNHKLKMAVLTAASICNLTTQQRDAFSVSTFNSEHIVWKSDMKSTKSHLHSIVQQLETYWNLTDSPKNQTVFEPLNFQYLLAGVRRRNLVVVVSDLLWSPEEKDKEKAFWESIAHMSFLKCEVLILHIQDYQSEIELDLPDQPINFVDLESGEKVKLNPSEIQEFYAQKQKLHLQSLKERSFNNGANYYGLDVSVPINQALMAFYVSRNKLI
jgi:hypothetical protein